MHKIQQSSNRNDKHTNKGVSETVPFTITSKIKYLLIKLVMEVKNTCNENRKKKKLKKKLEDGQTPSAHGLIGLSL